MYTEAQLVSFADFVLSNPIDRPNGKPATSDGLLSDWKEMQALQAETEA